MKMLILMFVITSCSSTKLSVVNSKEDGKGRMTLRSALVSCHNDESEGLDVLKKLYSKLKRKPAYWNTLGLCYLKFNSLKVSRYYFLKSLSLNKNYIHAHNNLGLVYYKLENYDSAISSFNKVLNLNSRHNETLYNLSELFIKFGHKENARKLQTKLSKDWFANRSLSSYVMSDVNSK